MRVSFTLAFTILATLAAAAPIDIEPNPSDVEVASEVTSTAPTATSDNSAPSLTTATDAAPTPTGSDSDSNAPVAGDSADSPIDELFEGARAVGSVDGVDDAIKQREDDPGKTFKPMPNIISLPPNAVEAIIGKLLSNAINKSQSSFARRNVADDDEDSDLRYTLAESLYNHANQRGGKVSKWGKELGPDLTIELIDTGLQTGINAAVDAHNQAAASRLARRSYLVPKRYEYL
ncbi:hypothetical protein DL89DRAFT_265206 [Linderina pennispora]|uniref:Uncharacterized protein n=1 Tax=Linderina pennispora TaxID=61395 RepID=A0A1Y1WI51_9FUNG|nr:uncharacterized protein DL89DRAFT_265206 [Linderina pennispora]ORX73045.1 hypothetical protein DL89DRAFT_265206 [Linderina pennispora]